VFMQMTALTECLVALATHERLCPAVGALVVSQVPASGERLAALATYERLNAAVDALMCAHIIASTERLAALATYERSRSTVGALMSAQTTAVSECRVAMIAREPVPGTSSFSLRVGMSPGSSRCAFAHFCGGMDVSHRLESRLLKCVLGLFRIVCVLRVSFCLCVSRVRLDVSAPVEHLGIYVYVGCWRVRGV
jgi:hypothetical protein